MARTSFYNDNANRAYPFVVNDELVLFADLPKSAVVDCGFMLGPQSGFVHGTHNVWLSKIEREGDQFVFTFKTDAKGLKRASLRFVRDLDALKYEIEYADTDDNQALSVSEVADVSVSECDAEVTDVWCGYLVTGPLDALLAAMPPSSSIEGKATVEPANLRELGGAYARSINIGNGERTRYETPEGCKPQCWPHDVQDIYIRGTCMTGPFRFKEGYNNVIRQDPSENSILFDAQVGGGEGEPCEQIPLFDGEVPPADSIFLEGGPACNGVIRSINGQGGRLVDVKGGLGTTVTAKPGEAEIEINVDTLDMAVCAEDDGFDDLSCSEESVSEDECACGPEP